MAIDTVLFDFFGVIYDDPQKALVRRHPGRVAEIAATALLLDTGDISYDEYFVRLAEITGESYDLLRELFLAPELINHAVVGTISQLKPHWRIGLLSNTCTEELDFLFAQHDLGSLFHTVVVSSETGLAKPDHRIFHVALERLGAKAGSTVFIDDSEPNVLAARQVGLTAIHFKDARQLRTELDKLGVSVLGPVGQKV
ncbi:MAG TPA: HAD family phosphatase [Candidatus Saccharimonadales bacterium]|nr:HAD family phosphatase [Candidatus Saccharimonadales bacterium]